MTRKEIVFRTIEFKDPERLALNSDMVHIGRGRLFKHLDAWTRQDDWGCIWKSLNPEKGDQGQVIKHPLYDWNQFEKYIFPDPYAEGRFDGFINELEKIDRNEFFVMGGLGKGPMHLLDDLRSFEKYLEDIILEPQRIEVLLNGIFNFLTGMVKQYGEFGLNAVSITDDQAIQTGPIFSMDLWKKYFKPRYKQLFDIAHNYNMKVYMHTCGKLDQHLIELHECGVDIIDNKQPELWMNSTQAELLKGKMTYSTCIDIQTCVFNISLDDIDAEVSRLIKTLTIKEGGFIGTYYPGHDLNIEEDKKNRMIQAYKKFRW